MADASGDAKPTPSTDQTASSDLRPAVDETKLATNPIGDASKEAPATENTTSTVAETASAAAANVASTATAAATGVKDSVFSMFGGGAKKEKKEEEDDDAKNEPSGSSKAKKDEEDDVCEHSSKHFKRTLTVSCRRRPRMRRPMYTSSLLSS